MSKARGISADIQSPRTKLLYFIYSAPNNRIKAEPGVKSNICTALGYKSDGHFHYDWNYLSGAGMIEEQRGFYVVTDEGKKEFALHETASRSNLSMILIGVAIIAFTFSIQFGLVPVLSVVFFGVALIVIGLVFLAVGRRSRPKLPAEAQVLLKELNKH
ncbi:MAG: hypothetical protein ACQCN6_11725 [Candidatus Bathyarchaeia archaeon]